MDHPASCRLQDYSLNTRLASLDALRGVAALAVIVRHMPGDVPAVGYFNRAFDFIETVGWVGVDLFFVLSGYLISGLLFQEIDKSGKFNPLRFWLRRGFKIWPSYFAAYGAAVALWWINFWWRGEKPWTFALFSNLPPNVLFIQNYFPPDGRWPHSWTLAIEEQFYISLPLAILLWAALFRREGLRGKNMGGFAALIAAGCLGVMLWRIWASAHGSPLSNLYYRTHFRFDALTFGVLLCWLFRYGPPAVGRIARNWIWAAPAVLVLLMPYYWPVETSRKMCTIGLTALYAAFGGAILLAAARPHAGSTGPALWRWWCYALRFIGEYSYTIYLAHCVVYRFPFSDAARAKLTGGSVWIDRGLFLFLSVGGGVALSYLVERPFLRIRDRLIPREPLTSPR